MARKDGVQQERVGIALVCAQEMLAADNVVRLLDAAVEADLIVAFGPGA